MQEMRPKLRPVQAHPATSNGQRVLVLQDPLQLVPGTVVVPHALGPVLAFCDGERTLNEIRAALIVRVGMQLTIEQLERITSQLDQALLLENERSAAAERLALEAFRMAPFREPSLAGRGYPEKPNALGALLDGYIEGLPQELRLPCAGGLRGLISPHIDYERGGPVYAGVWARATQAAQEAELVVILGTDHHGDFGRLTLTRQHYATPYGILPTDGEAVSQLAEVLGEEAVYGEELHHRSEHSIELAAVWLHHVLGGEARLVLPVLTGSFGHWISTGLDPGMDEEMSHAVAALGAIIARQRTLLVAAADLAHVGPAFGDPRPMGFTGRARLQSMDEELLETVIAGDAAGFFRTIQAEGDQRNICGLPPIYLMLRLLEGAQGMVTGYDRCPADAGGTSFVSICGVVLE